MSGEGESQEGLIIKVDEDTPSSKIRTVDIDARTNSDGKSRVTTGPLNGFLLALVLPERLEQTKVLVSFADYPDIKVRIEGNARNTFRLKMDAHTLEGEIVQAPSDIPVTTGLIIDVEGALPDAPFPIELKVM